MCYRQLRDSRSKKQCKIEYQLYLQGRLTKKPQATHSKKPQRQGREAALIAIPSNPHPCSPFSFVPPLSRSITGGPNKAGGRGAAWPRHWPSLTSKIVWSLQNMVLTTQYSSGMVILGLNTLQGSSNSRWPVHWNTQIRPPAPQTTGFNLWCFTIAQEQHIKCIQESQWEMCQHFKERSLWTCSLF